jgi:copper homeostasis protein
MKTILEVCVESVEGAWAAQTGGADRVELCANLLEGGTTPSWGTLQRARKGLRIGLQAMIRPRGGDFCYSAVEFETMKLDIEAAKDSGADGIVSGILKEDGSVDEKRMRDLIAIAKPLNVTFHRAFDMCRDPHEAMETLITLGVVRILTSGCESTALEGLDLIADLVRRAGERIVIMPGGGITEQNLTRILDQTGAREIHVAALGSTESPMQHRNLRCFMGGELRPPEFRRLTTDAGRINAFSQILGKG